MVRDYELMYIIRPELDEDGIQAAQDSVATLITQNGGEVVKTTQWGKRRLAYEVKHLRDGYYVIVKLRLDAAKVATIERALRIHDTVFRHLLVVDNFGAAESEAEAPPEPAATEAAPRNSVEAALDEENLEPVGAGADDEEEV